MVKKMHELLGVEFGAKAAARAAHDDHETTAQLYSWTHGLVETALWRFFTLGRLRRLVESASGEEENFEGLRRDLHEKLTAYAFEQFETRPFWPQFEKLTKGVLGST